MIQVDGHAIVALLIPWQPLRPRTKLPCAGPLGPLDQDTHILSQQNKHQCNHINDLILTLSASPIPASLAALSLMCLSDCLSLIASFIEVLCVSNPVDAAKTTFGCYP